MDKPKLTDKQWEVLEEYSGGCKGGNALPRTIFKLRDKGMMVAGIGVRGWCCWLTPEGRAALAARRAEREGSTA